MQMSFFHSLQRYFRLILIKINLYECVFNRSERVNFAIENAINALSKDLLLSLNKNTDAIDSRKIIKRKERKSEILQTE